MTQKQENFIEAFRSNYGGCRVTCNCGKEFYSSDGGWTWEEGEYEALEKSNAVCLDYTVTTIEFEGKEFVLECECWVPRMDRIIGFLDGHARNIAEYLSLEKKRKQEIADNAPTVDSYQPKTYLPAGRRLNLSRGTK